MKGRLLVPGFVAHGRVQAQHALDAVEGAKAAGVVEGRAAFGVLVGQQHAHTVQLQ